MTNTSTPEEHPESNDKDQKLQSLISSLPKQIKPENNLWPDIRRQIDPVQPLFTQEKSAPTVTKIHWMNWAIAASILFCFVSIFYAGNLSVENRLLREQLAQTMSPSQLIPSIENYDLIAESVTDKGCYVSEEQATIRENLAIIHMALEQIQAYLKQAPDNQSLNRKYLALSEQKHILSNQLSTLSF